MKIVPVKIKFKTLYKHRHLLTDDVKYNSLIISNLINTNVNLLNVEYDTKLDYDINKDDFILDKNGLYKLSYYSYYTTCECGDVYEDRHDIEFYNWKHYYALYKGVYNYITFNILTIVE